MSTQVLPVPTPVRIEDPNEKYLKEVGEIALEFINLRSADESRRGSTGKKAPYQVGKKPEGGDQLQSPRQGQAAGQDELSSAAAGPPPPPSRVPPTRVIAERLRTIGDQVDKELQGIHDETRQEFMKLLLKQSVFTITKEHFKMTCAVVLAKFQQQFRSGWAQISVVYDAMYHLIAAVRQEAAEDASRQTREQQVANFVAPTMAELGLLTWAVNHGGMEHFGEVIGTDDLVVIIESSVDPEN